MKPFLLLTLAFWLLLCAVYVLIGQVGMGTTVPFALLMSTTCICVYRIRTPAKTTLMVKRVKKQVRRRQQKPKPVTHQKRRSL